MKNTIILIIVIINLVLTIFIGSYLIYDIINKNKQEEPVQSNDNRIDIIGTVASIQETPLGIIMLVEDHEKLSNYDKASIKVEKDTMIIKTIYSKTFEPKDINIGDKVQVTFTGPVLDSYPVQAKAKLVWITDSKVG